MADSFKEKSLNSPYISHLEMRNIPEVYSTYEEALDCLKMPSDMFIVKLSADADSLDHVRDDLRFVYKVGLGIMKSPGHPSGNQFYQRQLPIIESMQKYRKLPVLLVWPDGITEYFGMYKYYDLKLKIAPSGFKYYEFKLVKVWNENQMYI